MDKALKMKKIWFAVAIISSVLAVCGIVMIPVFASKKIWILMVLGIVFVVHGFYGLAFYWMAFASASRTVRLLRAVLDENIYDLPTLSNHLSIDEKETDKIIRKCISSSYLTGYIYEDGILKKREIKKETRKIKAECPACGAPVEKDGEGQYTCEYCGTSFFIDARFK